MDQTCGIDLGTTYSALAMVNEFGKPEVIAHKNQVLNDWCQKEGTEASEIERSVGIEPKHFDRADDFLAAGSTQFTIGLNGPDYDMGPVRELLAWRATK